MEFRIVEEEYEAKLTPFDGWGGGGKVEHKRYRDGAQTLRAKMRGIGGRSSAAGFTLFINGALVGVLDGSGKKADLELDSRNGDSIPDVTVGDAVEVRRDGCLVVEGIRVDD